MNSETCSVRLVSITSPEVEKDGRKLTPEEFIAYTARVSNPGNQLNTETAPKLIKYLLDNNHYSPFEMADVGVEIVTSRGVTAQILRHWSFSFSEYSLRYAEAQEYINYPARRQDAKNRQNSVDDLSPDVKKWFSDMQQYNWDKAFSYYKQALDLGVAKEQARFLLPLGTKTTLFMKGNVRDWIFYLKLRSANGTQQEHMDIAKSIINTVFLPNFPVISEVMGWGK